MRFADLKTGKKLMGGYFVVVLFLGVAIFYQITSMMTMSDLQKEAEGRANDALTMSHIMERMVNVYGIIADSVINQNVEGAKKDFVEARAQALKDIETTNNLVDHEKEREWAADAEKNYLAYLETYEKQMLPILENREDISKRYHETVEVYEILGRVDRLYAIIADAIINQNFEESGLEFADAKNMGLKDIARIHEMVDHADERAQAKKFDESYRQYFALFEDELLPLLKQGDATSAQKIKNLDEQIDQVRDATQFPLRKLVQSLDEEAEQAIAQLDEISKLDEAIDEKRMKTDEALESLIDSLVGEMEEAARVFANTQNRAMSTAVVLSIIGIIFAIVVALLITRSITVPLANAVNINNRLSDGDLTVDINVDRSDEIGE